MYHYQFYILVSFLVLLFACEKNSSEPKSKQVQLHEKGSFTYFDFHGGFSDSTTHIFYDKFVQVVTMSVYPNPGSDIPDSVIYYFGLDSDGNYLTKHYIDIDDPYNYIASFRIDEKCRLKFAFISTSGVANGLYSYHVYVTYLE